MKYGSLVYNSTLNEKYAAEAYSVSDFVKNAMADRRTADNFTVEMINSASERQVTKQRRENEVRGRLSDSDPVFMPLKPVPENERGERRKLSVELHKKYYDKIALIQYSQLPTDDIGLRYANEFFMEYGDPDEVGARNAEIYDNLADPKGHMKDVIGYHYEALKKLGPDGFNVEELAAGDFSDADLVKNFERINYCSQLIAQFENIKKYLKNKNIQPSDAEDKARLDECEEIMRRYEVCALPLNTLNSRLGLIDEPFYELCDINSPEYINFSKCVSVNDPDRVFDRETDPFSSNGRGALYEFVAQGVEMNMLGVLGDMKEAERHFEATGVDKKDIAFRIVKDGKATEVKDYKHGDINVALTSGQGVRVEIFDKNAPDNKIALFSDTRGDFAKSALKNRLTAPKKPEEPGFFKKLLHKISNKNYKKEFDDYYKKKSVYDAYTAEQKHRAVVDSAREGKRGRERIINGKNETIMQKVSALPHKTEKDLAFHNEINEIIRPDREAAASDKIRDFLCGLSPEKLGMLQSEYVNTPDFNLRGTLYASVGEMPPVENQPVNGAPQIEEAVMKK